MKVPFLKLVHHNLLFKDAYHAALDSFLSSTSYVLGEQVSLFESEFSTFVGSAYSVGTSNCLDALELLFQASSLKKGDEVIVPSNTYIATWLSILNTGLHVVPVEPDLKTFTISLDAIIPSVTPRTKAILLVDLYGYPTDIGPILDYARDIGILVFQDCAQSHGSLYRNTPTGSLADASAFSFYPSKNLGALGDAGVVATSDIQLADKIRALRNYGSLTKYHNTYIGRNSRLDELQAAFLRIKLPFLTEENNVRSMLANRYINKLSSLSDYILLPSPPSSSDSTHAWHLFVVLVKDRTSLNSFLLSRNIDTMYHYPIPPHKQLAFASYPEISSLSLPVSEFIHKHCISLPLSGYHTQQEVDYVSACIHEYFSLYPNQFIRKPCL